MEREDLELHNLKTIYRILQAHTPEEIERILQWLLDKTRYEYHKEKQYEQLQNETYAPKKKRRRSTHSLP